MKKTLKERLEELNDGGFVDIARGKKKPKKKKPEKKKPEIKKPEKGKKPKKIPSKFPGKTGK